MMYETKHKYFNNKINLLFVAIIIWPLMWQQQHVNGKSSTYDKDSLNIQLHGDYAATGTHENVNDADNGGGGDGDGDIFTVQDAEATKITMTPTVSMVTTIVAAEDNNNNATIYVHINENDNNSNKLPQNATYQGYWTRQRQMEMEMEKETETATQMKTITKELEKPPPMEQAIMPADQLNETDYEIIPEDIKNTDCVVEQKEKRENSRNNCDAQRHEKKMDDESTQAIEYESGIKAENKLNASETIAIIQKDLIHQFSIKYKQIRRITLFTCRRHCSFVKCHDGSMYTKNGRDDTKRQTLKLLQLLFSHNVERVENSFNSYENFNDLLIKIIEIDHLGVKRREATKTLRRGRRSSKSSSDNRYKITSPKWLDQVLKSNKGPQVVVLDLACGNASRRLLEMASSKALFNSMYHWLLMEDYVFNRQTEIDDADDIKNETNCSGWGCGPTSGSNGNGNSKDNDKDNNNNNTIYSNIDGNSNNTDKEVVNDNSKSAMLEKELSYSTTDVVGASTSVTGKQYKRQLLLLLPSLNAAGVRTERVVDERNTDKKSYGSGGVAADEDDMEIIEKFLEKLNININTELILAKRRMRSISTSKTSGMTSSPAVFATVSLSALNESITMMPLMPSQAKTAAAAASPAGSSDYNTLEKMDYYILYDVWNPGRQYGGELNISQVGEFSLQQGLQLADWYSHTTAVLRRTNMHMARVRCLVVVTHKNNSDSLLNYLTSHYDTHLDSMNRFNFALLSHVRDLFNFSFILSKTSTWGYLKNGKFDGMIGALVRKQADIGGSPIFFRIERAKVIDYTTRTWVARPCFIFRHPRSTKKDRIVFLQPFSNDVWVLVAVCGIVSIFLLWALTALELAAEQNSENLNEITTEIDAKSSLKIKHGSCCLRCMTKWLRLCCNIFPQINRSQRCGLFVESILFYVGSICQQGLSFSTNSFVGRCIVIISLLFSFAIYQFYSASIVGTLLMEKPKTIKTLRDLIHSNLEIGIEDIVYNRDYFLRTKDPDTQELYARKVTSVPKADSGFVDGTSDLSDLGTQTPMTAAQKAKAYRDILHSHETGAHAKPNDASNWYEPGFGVNKIRRGRFAFHVDVATAYKIIADTFNEKEICELTEIQLFPPQKMVSIVQKGSPLRKIITYGLRRATEAGLTDYERKVWHSPKPRCIKQLNTDDLQVDMQTFTSALFVLIFGFVVSLIVLAMEIIHQRMWQRKQYQQQQEQQ